ncbi:MAG: hypothetical protein ACYC2H_08565 [Thermoplasmatota archaeon]
MAVLRLGKAREATMLTAEAYKRHVRRYLETVGYAEVRNSAREGSLADLVFAALVNAHDRRPLWVESKATTLSLQDKKFAEEVKHYLAAWLNRRPAVRFDYWVFACKLRKPESWERIFGDQLDADAVFAWLAKNAVDAVTEKTIAAAPPQDVISFFVETQVVEGDGVMLDECTADRHRAEGLIHAGQKRANEELELIEKRRDPITATKAVLTANLLPCTMPPDYAVIHTDFGSLDQIRAAFQDDGVKVRPPFAYMGRGRLLAIFHDDVVRDFRPIAGELVQRLALDEVEANHPAELVQLMNRVIEKFIFRRGARRGNTGFLLRAERDIAEGRPRAIESHGRRLQVAAPKWVLNKEEPANLLPAFGSLQAQPAKTATREVSYVYHEGFSAWFRRVWSGYYVNLQLHRAFTEEGGMLIAGTRAAALDETYRKPEYNRADAQARKLEVLGDYLFGTDPPWPDRPAWSREVRFGRLLTIPIGWEPVRVDMRVPSLFESGPEDGS